MTTGAIVRGVVRRGLAPSLFMVIAASSWALEGGAPPGTDPLTAAAPVAAKAENPEIIAIRGQIGTTPDDPLLYVRLGYLLLNSNALADAKSAFDEALKRNSHSHAALTGEGIILARSGRLKEAEQLLQRALLFNPDPVRTQYELGLVYEQEGEPDKALAAYKEGIAKSRQGRK